jgi:divinyl chlorophyllide a 8-vinyl-reductase
MLKSPPRRRQRVLLLGSTGTIGLATAAALLQRDHEVVCFLRPRQKGDLLPHQRAVLKGATLRWGDPGDPFSLRQQGIAGETFDAVVSCMASRTGLPEDAWRIDHDAHLTLLEASKEAGIPHFVLLSALCVQKPRLAFQHAKLAFEKSLIESGLSYSIVRPTAFFKSLSGQWARVKNGKPFLIFGDGRLTACKPISDADLGQFMASCLEDPERQNGIFPIGGPGPAITPLEQGQALFSALGLEPRFKKVPVGLMDFIIGVLIGVGKVWPAAAAKAELARIGRYYATESMLVWDAHMHRYDAEATPSYGTQSLFEAYEKWAQGEGPPALGDHAVF